MGNKNYLDQEEIFKEILNQEEVQRIENPEIRAVRQKYWELRHKVFLDEQGIPDGELEKVSDRLIEQEQRELEQFKKK